MLIYFLQGWPIETDEAEKRVERKATGRVQQTTETGITNIYPQNIIMWSLLLEIDFALFQKLYVFHLEKNYILD